MCNDIVTFHFDIFVAAFVRSAELKLMFKNHRLSSSLTDYVLASTRFYTRREMVHYRQEKNPFVKILLTQNEYRLESNILLLRQKINFLC